MSEQSQNQAIDVLLEEMLNPPPTPEWADPFFEEVRRKNTRKDGTEKDPRLYTRFQNETCRRCFGEYKKKFPNKPFKIRCNGIPEQEDFRNQAKLYAKLNGGVEPTLDMIREIHDSTFWGEKYVKVKDDSGQYVPFVARWYQVDTLKCTALSKIDRWGRGLGKTTCGVVEELHRVCTKQNYEILVLAPQKSQALKWYLEVKNQIDNSPELKKSYAGSVQQPFYQFKFKNGSTISIFTAGSKSGKGADSIRSQSPRRVRLEEQDYLSPADYDAVLPLATRYVFAKINPSEFHGSSTPTGARLTYYDMCQTDPTIREFYFPIHVHPDWGPEMEEECRRKAKTQERYDHEYLAVFGDLATGVFKQIFVDIARKNYSYGDCAYDGSKMYVMGVDWNGEGTGTKIYIVEYNPLTQMRKVVDFMSIDAGDSTTTDSIEAIVHLTQKWHCAHHFFDAGFGFAQDQLIKRIGVTSYDPDLKRLANLNIIDFGKNLKTLALVPKRDPNSKYIDDSELERRAKPFMVEGCVMAFEQKKVEYSEADKVLDEQLRAYKVKSYTPGGLSNTYDHGGIGDHNLDAFMLAMLGIELNYGLFFDAALAVRLARVSYVSGFGMGQAPTSPMGGAQINPGSALEKMGVPSRSGSVVRDANANWRVAAVIRGANGQGVGAYTTPGRGMGTPRQTGGSRTAFFRGGSRSSSLPGYGRRIF